MHKKNAKNNTQNMQRKALQKRNYVIITNTEKQMQKNKHTRK